VNKRLMAVLCSAFVGAAVVPAQAYAACSASPRSWTPSPGATSRPQVLVVGVYHMANPNKDVADVRAGNVLSPKRQSQMKKVVAVLKRFRPTKIAVERLPKKDPALASSYADYVAGKHRLAGNEIQQIGFRLAKELDLKTVCGIDANIGLNVTIAKNYAKAEGLMDEYNAQIERAKNQARAGTAYLDRHTILQYLTRLNSNTWVSNDVGFYYRQAHFSQPDDWIGADMVSKWFKRNMRIYANTIHLIGSPRARILVIIGAGHLGWLRPDFARDPTIHLRRLDDFIE
jgi:hypothetical protein